MPLLLVLNELSYREVKARYDDLSDALHKLVSVLRQARRHRTDVALVTERQFIDLPMSDDFSLRKWAADGRNADALRYIRSMRNRAPFRAVVTTSADSEAEYFHAGVPADGLGVAHLMGGLALSLPLEAKWDHGVLPLVQRTLRETAAGDVVLADGEASVRHAFSASHVDVHREWMCTSALTGLISPGDLWDAREDVFPHLRFLARVADDLHKLPATALDAVKVRLAELELAAAEWSAAGGPLPSWRSKVTPDSESRKSLCWFADDEDGERRLFDLHARFTPGPGRLHLRLDDSRRALVIAYIGRKLV